MKCIDELIRKLNNENIIMNGCTEKQISELQQLCNGFCLPQSYIEFMKCMGNGTDGQFMRGDSCFMNEIFYLKEGANELLIENNSKNTLLDEDFVFWMSQGCMFCFFKLNEGDNPPIYFYNEHGNDKFVRIAYSFTDFLISRLEMNGSLFKENE